jgi:hypothetical protein
MPHISEIPVYITISEDAPFEHNGKTFVGNPAATDLGIHLESVGDNVEFHSPFGVGKSVVSFAYEGLNAVHIVKTRKGAYIWPSVAPGKYTPETCWNCCGGLQTVCGGNQPYCNGKPCEVL